MMKKKTHTKVFVRNYVLRFLRVTRSDTVLKELLRVSRVLQRFSHYSTYKPIKISFFLEAANGRGGRLFELSVGGFQSTETSIPRFEQRFLETSLTILQNLCN